LWTRVGQWRTLRARPDAELVIDALMKVRAQEDDACPIGDRQANSDEQQYADD